MGICDSENNDKNDKNNSLEEPKMPNSENIKKQEEKKSYSQKTHPIKSNIKYSKILSNSGSGNNKCPELAKYDSSTYYSGKRSELSDYNITGSIFSSGQTEEEVIIRGEINKKCKNKEEDFDNSSFKKLVKINGGIILKKNDNYSNISSIHRVNPVLKRMPDIKSMHTVPIKKIKRRILDNMKNGNIPTTNNISENNKNVINERLNKLLYENKINVFMTENCPLLSIPKMDEPLPNIDELSTESQFLIGRNSLISE